LHFNLAVKDLIGGWKDNAHVLRFPKSCSSTKTLVGIHWQKLEKYYGNTSLNCPISPVIFFLLIFIKLVFENGF